MNETHRRFQETFTKLYALTMADKIEFSEMLGDSVCPKGSLAETAREYNYHYKGTTFNDVPGHGQTKKQR